MPREQQSNHTGISAPGSTTHKSSSWIPDDIGNGSRSHHRVPIPNIFAWVWWAVILGSIMKRLMVAAFMVRPVRKEHCSFVIFPHTTNQWSILQGFFLSLVIFFLGDFTHPGGSSHLFSYLKSQILPLISVDEPYFLSSYENSRNNNYFVFVLSHNSQITDAEISNGRHWCISTTESSSVICGATVPCLSLPCSLFMNEFEVSGCL